MRNISLKLEDATVESIDKEATEQDVSRSEHIRDILEARRSIEELREEHERAMAEYERAIEEKDARIQELENELRAANRRIDDVNDVVDDTREMVRVRKEDQSMEARRRQTNIFKRTWWRIAGEPALDDETDD